MTLIKIYGTEKSGNAAFQRKKGLQTVSVGLPARGMENQRMRAWQIDRENQAPCVERVGLLSLAVYFYSESHFLSESKRKMEAVNGEVKRGEVGGSRQECWSAVQAGAGNRGEICSKQRAAVSEGDGTTGLEPL